MSTSHIPAPPRCPENRCEWCGKLAAARGLPVVDGLHEKCAREAAATASVDGERLTRDAIGALWGVSRETVRLIEEHALWKLYIVHVLSAQVCRVCDGHGSVGTNRTRPCAPCAGNGFRGGQDSAKEPDLRRTRGRWRAATGRPDVRAEGLASILSRANGAQRRE